MQTAEDLLKEMGIDPQEAIKVDKQLTDSRSRDKRICLCGHSVARHDMTLERPSCVIGKQFCPCRKIQPVLVVADTRPFIRKTDGASVLHALVRGMAAAAERGQSVQKIAEAWHCHKCEATDVRLSPVPVSSYGVPMQVATGYDSLLCDDCRINR